ncbi:FKBP-type peptidyl-prolyl cis-trans isomerase [Sphingobacterium sp. UT-1RO-CII-1]|uniref:FKBP-type peptidyl-prolyl cis-trans isomerase n=1 Tax=Sphingobacterium sp. UT-1RO-CII-1 TaxID=2995225 RepID=UPI00227AA410|nr:FKBP-type peptidyl-prolyl cis-trans isomerase [Sphingobacterium sp. UT-1RO-CII-1]MCY4780049.1 FKBP-type peptidyl-prolyl cis-trans isomerase [Sphingobacterium sp. UT-1RO-CII-1]
MKKSILFLSAAVTLLATAACQNFKKGEGGLEYNIVKDAGAEKAQSGDLLSVDMIVTTDRKDSLLQSTYDIGLPQIVNIAPDSIPGLYAGDYNSMFKFLGEGDSAIFKLNLDTMAARMGQPKPEFADKFVTFKIKVRKHFKKGSLTDSALYAQIDEYFKSEVDGLKNGEEGKLASYISTNKLDPKKTESGLQYAVNEEGKGNKPVIGDTVVVNYTGKLVGGKIFDTNNAELAKKENKFNPMRQYEPLRFRIGHDPVIQGWTEAFQLLTKGSKATLLIPSHLGYGERGGGEIPPYAPLVFDVELVDVIAGPKADTTAVN